MVICDPSPAIVASFVPMGLSNARRCNKHPPVVAEYHFSNRQPASRSVASSRPYVEAPLMCRNIKILFNFDPPVTEEEIRSAALQFVRKVSGFNKPSKANESAFLSAVDDIAEVSRKLLHSLETSSPPRSRTEEAAKARARAVLRFPGRTP